MKCYFQLNLLLVLLSSRGQGHPQGDSEPYFGPSKKLDFELEMVNYPMPQLMLFGVSKHNTPLTNNLNLFFFAIVVFRPLWLVQEMN